jgi:hypothetical protein
MIYFMKTAVCNNNVTSYNFQEIFVDVIFIFGPKCFIVVDNAFTVFDRSLISYSCQQTG